MAERLGAHTEVAETPDQLGPAFRRAAEANKNGQPSLVEAKTKAEETVAHYYR